MITLGSTSTVSAATTYTWVGGTSTDWGTNANWSPSTGTPGSATDDVVIIPAVGAQLVLAATPANPILSLTFTGTGKSLTINAGVTLTVTNAVTLNSSTAASTTGTLNAVATGALVCGSLQIGSALGSALSGNLNTTLTVTVLVITINNDLVFNSGFNAFRNNANLTHTSGTITVNGSVTTVNANTDNTSAYTMGATAPRLNLAGATPYNLSGTGNNTFSFNNTNATVDYQTTSSISLPSTPAGLLTYRNLIISGGAGSVKTLGGNTVISGIGTLQVNAETTLNLSSFSLTMGTGAATLQNVGGGTAALITGSGQLSMGAGNIAITYTGSGAVLTSAIIEAPILLTGTRTMNVADDGTAASVDFTITSVISSSGAFGIAKGTATASVMLLTGANTYTGTSTLTQGTLILGHPEALGPAGNSVVLTAGTLVLSTDVSVNAYNVTFGGNVTITPNRATAGAGIIHTLGTITAGASRTITVGSGANVTSGVTGLTFGSAIFTNTSTFTINNGSGVTTEVRQTAPWTGTVGIIKAGAGTLILSQANNFAGASTLTLGNLILSHTQGLGPAGLSVTLTAGILFLATDVSVNAYNIILNGNASIASDKATTGAGITHILGSLSSSGTRTLTIRDGNNTTSGVTGITFSGASTLTGATTFTVSNGISTTTELSLPAIEKTTLLATFNGTGNVVQTGPWGSGSGGLTKAGTGTLTLSQANTYTGLTTISAGTVIVSHPGGIGSTTLTLGAATLELATDVSVNPFTVTMSGAGTIVSNKATPGSAGITHTLGGLSIGTLNLAVTGGTNAITGVTGVAFSFPTNYTAATPSFTITNGSGTSTALLTLAAVVNNNRTVTINGNGDMNQTGVWGGGAASGGITYSGTGSLTLDQANIYSGTITLNSGKLNINHASGLGAAGAFVIAGGSLGNTSGSNIVSTNHAITWNANILYDSPNDLNLGTGTITLASDRQVTVSGVGKLTLGGTLNAGTRNLTKAGTGTLSFASQTVTLHDVTISAGTLSSTTASLNISGDFANSGTFVHNNGTVVFNAITGQSIGPANFFDLTISGDKNSGVITFTDGTIGVADALLMTATEVTYLATTGNTINFNGTIAQSIPAFDYNSLSISGERGGATVTLPNGGTIRVATAFTVTATGTVYAVTGNIFDFNGSGAQTIPAFTFYTLIISNAGTKAISTSVTARTITINNNAQLDLDDSGMLTLTL